MRGGRCPIFEGHPLLGLAPTPITPWSTVLRLWRRLCEVGGFATRSTQDNLRRRFGNPELAFSATAGQAIIPECSQLNDSCTLQPAGRSVPDSRPEWTAAFNTDLVRNVPASCRTSMCAAILVRNMHCTSAKERYRSTQRSALLFRLWLRQHLCGTAPKPLGAAPEETSASSHTANRRAVFWIF